MVQARRGSAVVRREFGRMTSPTDRIRPKSPGIEVASAVSTPAYSHSMVPGGLLVTSTTTRLTAPPRW